MISSSLPLSHFLLFPSLQVRDQVLHLFPYKAKLFAMEMLSVVLTPVVLCFSLPPCAPDILEFIRQHTTYVDGVGAVCDYSTFDLNKYGNEEFATNTKESTLLEVGVGPRTMPCYGIEWNMNAIRIE